MTHETLLLSDPSAPKDVQDALFTAIQELPFEVARLDAHTFAESQGLETDEGRLVLGTLAQAAFLIHPSIEKTRELNDAGFFSVTGGDLKNPHRGIDTIGARAYHDQKTFFQSMTIAHHIEEDHRWVYQKRDSDATMRFIVLDPIDDTEPLSKGKFSQSTGMILTDRTGHFITGGIVNLVTGEILFVEHGNTHIFAINKDSARPAFERKTMEDFPPPFTKDRTNIRYATLDKRREALKKHTQFDSHCTFSLDAFGGYALSALFHGTIDALIDPIKGQPWYEAVIWGWVAKEMGFTVIGLDGKPINFGDILLRNSTGADPENPDDLERVKLIIAKTPDIARQIRLLLDPPATYPFSLSSSI